MPRTYFAAALLATMTMAEYRYVERRNNKIVYRPDVDIDEYRVDPTEYPMAFKWPKNDFRCGATMISPTVALTAAHCITADEVGGDLDLQVELADGQTYGIKEFRPNDCLDFSS